MVIFSRQRAIIPFVASCLHKDAILLHSHLVLADAELLKADRVLGVLTVEGLVQALTLSAAHEKLTRRYVHQLQLYPRGQGKYQGLGLGGTGHGHQ